MNLHLILICAFILLGLGLRGKTQASVRKAYIFICCILLVLSASLRSLDYGHEGSDTMNYYYMFQAIGDYSFSDIWKMAINRYVYGTSEEDIGFLLLEKVISLVTSDFHVFTFIAQLVFFVPFGIYLYKYSTSIGDLIFAFVFYLALVHTHAMTGTRQFYAMGFGILFFLYSNDKKYKSAIISLVLGMSIHLSLLLVVLPFVLSYLKPSQLKAIHLLLFLSFPIVMLMPNQIISFMGGLIGSEKYAEYGTKGVVGGTETFIFLLELLSLLCYWGIKKESMLNDKIKRMYAMVPCFTFFGPLIYSSGSMIRISMYSYLYLTLLLPLAVQSRFRKDYTLVLSIFIAVLSLLVLMNSTSDYHFFWQVDPISTW
ncbi:EpsG family protein [Bacteroides congonensis]|uniref:EpsG family protein n=1 Tax=Bacteroides congonensis TaxID=1871006 RepID=UPI002674B6D6|nr:EpsG family protein [Bacteroides congonensis]